MSSRALPTKIAVLLGMWLLASNALALTDSEAKVVAPRLVPAEPGVRLTHASRTEVRIALDAPGGGVVGELWLSTGAPPWEVPRFTTPSFYYTIQAHQPGQDVTDRLVALAHSVAARDDGTLGFVREPSGPPQQPWGLWIAALAVWVIAGLVEYFRKGKIIWELKLTHLAPAGIQVVIFVYWWLYWPGVAGQFPAIAAQIVLAYAIDEFVNMWLYREWHVGVGPIPIILSANLFVWFGAVGAVTMITVALLSRVLIRRGNRHILNPSAAGLSAALLLSLAFPRTFLLDGVFSRLSVAPNLSELLIVLALIPQLRFRIVLLSVGAAIGLMLGGHYLGNIPGLAMPGTLLMLALLVTDPATTPKSPIGQLASGVFVGVGVAVVTSIGFLLGAPDDRLAKVLPVPLANLLAPQFEALGVKAGALLDRWRIPVLKPSWNLLHVAVWLWLVVPGLSGQKAATFNGAMHWTYGTPLVARGADDVPRCENNPVFCQPFMFRREAELWTERLSGSGNATASTAP